MFDLDAENLWMGPRDSRRKPTKALRGTFKRKTGYKVAKRDFSKVKPGSFFETVTKGYSGSAKTEYLKRQKAFRKAQDEKKYSQKLKSEYGVASAADRFRSFVKPKKKSIYKTSFSEKVKDLFKKKGKGIYD